MGKMKIYLDTNTIVDFFINSAKSLKRKEELVVPTKYQFFVEKAGEIEFITSLLTKIEIVRELVSGFGMKKNDIEPTWNDFMKSLNCKFIDKFETDLKVLDIVYSVPMKIRTVINFQHLFIAMREGAHILTGDKDLVSIVRKHKIYDKIITYPELRGMFD